MSSNQPFEPAGTGSTGPVPEYVGQGPQDDPARDPGRRGWPLLGLAAAGVVAVVGAAGWAAYTFLSGGGTQPAEVLPANTAVYVSLDLDPAASQKIEAIKLLNKFPGAAEELDMSSTDDLRRLVFEQIKDDGDCGDLDYARDFEPWIGERLAVALVPEAGHEAEGPVVALQVLDRDAARSGVRALATCMQPGDYGFAFLDDYVLLTDSQQRADALVTRVSDAPGRSLAESASYRDWTGQVGEPGIVTVYAGPDAPAYVAGLQRDLQRGWVASSMTAAEAEMERQRQRDRVVDEVTAIYQDFEGAAVALRFDDGAVEVEAAAGGMPRAFAPAGAGSASTITELPATTAAAISVDLREGWLRDYLDSLGGLLGGSGADEIFAEAEHETGLRLPEDVETLLGDGFSLALDADVDFARLASTGDVTTLPLGIRISGDEEAILPVVDKIREALGSDGDVLRAESGPGVVALSLHAGYADALVSGGGLGGQASFQQAVPDATRAGSVLFVNFDAGDWAEEAAEAVAQLDHGAGGGPVDTTVRDNVAPLDALGASTWVDGDVQHGLLRLTTD